MYMHNEVELQLIGNVIIDWCSLKAKENEFFHFDQALSSTYRKIRVSTNSLELVFPPSDSVQGYWGNGYHLLYEVENTIDEINISCLASTEGLSIENNNLLDNLLESAGVSPIENSSVYIIQSWNLSEELENINQVTELLNRIYDYELKFFENHLLKWSQDNSHNIPAYPTVRQEMVLNSDLPDMLFVEGAIKSVITDRYERNPKARARCILAHGVSCKICGFNFGSTYGEEFAGKIEVHHKKPLHEIGKSYVVDPVKDMIPVCPNCHMIIHSKKEGVYTENEVKAMLYDRNKNCK